MTNAEKFKEIFGIEPDCGRCNPYPCEENDCKYWAECENQPGCPCDNWWDWEFEESTTENDLEVDCISRFEVTEIINEEWDTDIILDRIEALPSVTPQEPRWIPVSEKLPEPFTFVNATCRSLVDDRENWVVETIYLPIPKEVNKHGYSDWGNIPMLNWGEAEVIAWVERIIPQPYKAESENKS